MQILPRQQERAPMPLDWTDCTPETLAAAIRATREERIANGLDPDTGYPVKRPTLAEIILMPLRPVVTTANQDRQSRLAVLISELIEEGYSTIEIRRQCDFEDAAVEENY